MSRKLATLLFSYVSSFFIYPCLYELSFKQLDVSMTEMFGFRCPQIISTPEKCGNYATELKTEPRPKKAEVLTILQVEGNTMQPSQASRE